MCECMCVCVCVSTQACVSVCVFQCLACSQNMKQRQLHLLLLPFAFDSVPMLSCIHFAVDWLLAGVLCFAFHGVVCVIVCLLACLIVWFFFLHRTWCPKRPGSVCTAACGAARCPPTRACLQAAALFPPHSRILRAACTGRARQRRHACGTRVPRCVPGLHAHAAHHVLCEASLVFVVCCVGGKQRCVSRKLCACRHRQPRLLRPHPGMRLR